MSIFSEEECPHCGEIIDVDVIWSDCDSADEFTFECPHCRMAVAAAPRRYLIETVARPYQRPNV